MPKTILLADDSVTIQKVVAISFASEDVTVLTVDNGDDAIAKARETRPDIVLADVVMPGKSGYEVCEAIKADPELAQIPVLLLTGTFEAFDEVRAREVGSAGHIAKPFEAQALVDEVRRLIESATASATPPPAPAESAESPNEADGAFDFFDDEEGAPDLTPPQDALDDAGDLEFQNPASGFTFGDDDLIAPASPLESPEPATPDEAPRAQPVADVDASPLVDAIPMGDELEPPLAASPSAAFEGDSLDDSLAPDASRSGDQPFDFSLAEEVTDPTDPLADLDSVPPVGAEDLAQATVIDPLGASGYDVSSSDLGPPMADPQPDPPPVATRPDEAELTMLAPEYQPEANAAPDTDPVASVPIANDLTTALGHDPLYPGLSKPSQAEPIAVAVDEDQPADLAADLYAEATPVEPTPLEATPVEATPMEATPLELTPEEPVPADAAETPAPSAAEPADALMAAIGPELRQQLHDTLEKIAWESFGDLTEAIVRQAVERVETIAWEVIPRMAETLIQEEIRRMKAEPEDA
jgi:CheY-like chemotaxis protein